MIHNIRFREFIYENENEDKLTEAILNLFPDAEIEIEEAEGLTENKILILTGSINKKRQTKELFNRIVESNYDKIIKDLDKKVDEKGNLFLRLSKKDAMEDKLTIVESGDAIHLKIKIAAFPAKKDVAIKKIKEAILKD